MNVQYRWLLAAGAPVALVGALGTQALAQPAGALAPLGAAAKFSGPMTSGVPGGTMVKPPGSARARLPIGPGRVPAAVGDVHFGVGRLGTGLA
jgi:hypothetical protein